MRLIDADALIESLSINPEECPGCPEPEWLEQFADILDSAETVEVKNENACGKENTMFGGCIICGHELIWESDFSYEDCGYEGEGLVQFFHCPNCGAEIEVCSPEIGEEDEQRT